MAKAMGGFMGRGDVTRSVHGMVTQAIGIDILAGRFPSGQVLPGEDELLHRFGVSRTALREALKTLAAKGMIVPEGARRHARVAAKRMAHVRSRHHRLAHAGGDGYRFHAASVRDPPRHRAGGGGARLPAGATTTALARAGRSLLDEMAPHPRCGSSSSPSICEFHKTILTATGNPLMQSIGVGDRSGAAAAFRRSAPTDDPRRHAATVAEHRRVYEAIAARDAAGASAVDDRGDPQGRRLWRP